MTDAPAIAALKKELAQHLERIAEDVNLRRHIAIAVLEHAGTIMPPDQIMKLIMDIYRFVSLPADVAKSAEVVEFKKDQ